MAKSRSDAVLPLASRSIDIWLAAWFVMFAFSTTFTDLHNFTASVMGVEVRELKGRELVYPPKVLTDLYFRWAETVDPLLYSNPVWWQAIEWMNLCILTPTALIFPYFLLRGKESVRVPAIVVSAFTTYSLVICIGATLFGPEKSADPSTFTGIYLIYLLQPYVVIARFWSDAPFRSISPTFNSILVLLTSINFAVFFTYVLKWFVLYQPEVFPAAIVPALQALKSIP